MNPRNFFAELKRRNVYKVAVAYLVAAWLIIQIATQVFPFFEIPNWAVRLVVLLLILGFPIVLVLSWAFEITPEGIKRESEITPNESITHHTGRKIVAITVVLAIAAAAMLTFQLFHSRSPAKQQAPTTSSLETPAAIPAKSIAVLPFENLSDDKSNAYFAEGIQDEILTHLSKVADLKVISRTSTQKYQSAPNNLREVGKELGVANLLEGSVQKAGNAVHINVQLIKAATDAHVWAESYNRKLDDIFGVEGEVASAIAEQLNARLSGEEEEALATKPTQSVAAYDAYLRGISIEHSRYSYGAYQEAAQDYATAVQADPKFGLAWARLGVIRSFLYFNSVERNINTAAAVKGAAERAMSLLPDSAEAWTAQGAYRYRVLRDFEGAVAAYRQALAKSPNNSYVLQNLAFVLRRLGRWDEAEKNYQKALELDPRDISLLNSMGAEFYNYLRRFDDAHAVLDRALAIAPDSPTVHVNLALVLQSEGRLTEAAEQIARIPQDSTDDFVLTTRTTQALYERRFKDGIQIIERKLRSLPAGQTLDSVTDGALVQLGFLQQWTGHPDEAARTFARAILSIKPTADTVIAPEANGLPYILALACAGLGDKEKALAQAHRAVQDYSTDAVAKPGAELALAQIQALFGDADAAIAAIPHLLEVPAGITRADLRFNPLWDPVRKDPRFQTLCQKPSQ